MRVFNKHTRSRPVVFHAAGLPGHIAPHSLTLKRNLFYSIFDNRTLAIPFHIITWNSQIQTFSLLERCAKKLDLPLTVLGRGIKNWINSKKIDITLNFLKRSKMHVIMGLDAYDVLIFPYLPDLPSDEGIMFGAEQRFWPDLPDMQLCKSYEESVAETKYMYLNSGMWVGTRECCIEFFSKAQEFRKKPPFSDDPEFNKMLIKSDQTCFHFLFPKCHDFVKLDYRCSLFQNLSYIDPQDLIFVKI